MRLRIGTALVVVLVGYLAYVAWRHEHMPAMPSYPSHPLADLGAVKSDLFVFARAERAFYASVGRYAQMGELRAEGLLSLPPDTRWPYSYYVYMPAPHRFFVVAVGLGPLGGRPVALAIDEHMDMRKFEPTYPEGPHRRRNKLRARFT
jgi:hypothetical protein